MRSDDVQLLKKYVLEKFDDIGMIYLDDLVYIIDSGLYWTADAIKVNYPQEQNE